MYRVLNIIWTLTLLGILSITFVQEQEATNGENSCGPDDVQVKIVNADSVVCVDEDTAKSWIESDFAVAFDGQSEQRLDQQEVEREEPQQQEVEQQEIEQQEVEQQEVEQQEVEQQEVDQLEAEQETESESNSEVISNIVAENSCDPGQVQVKIIKDDIVRCVEKATADLWIEGNFAVAFDGQSDQESNQQIPNQQESEEQESEQEESEQEESEQEVKSESGSEDTPETVGEISCDADEVRVKIINADSVVCVDEDTANSWIESDFAVKF